MPRADLRQAPLCRLPPNGAEPDAVGHLGGHCATPNATAADAAARQAIDAYDEFLGLLDSNEARQHLKRLTGDFEKDPTFQTGRELSHKFRNGLQQLFFESNDNLTRLTQTYGVF